ncbi:MAG TPA: acyltransferase [Methylomusa anaerophila]|uniref:Maltose O-acetyltransferase n=1 Tax=Methylomusa anaerophila TaxID=1930071 RepID=A0A348AGC4_9FIRM|nr:acyltransferase [Methylomusa anaerophila]BBB90122.1 maltose O-acetyltransferase [Methylomusa anaerophila]HML88154.1 acyltransferase [Methylomusa anaerophila]
MSGNKSGRNIFEKCSFIINLAVSFFKLMPNGVNRFIWNWIEGWRGICWIGLRYCILKASSAHCGNNVFVGPFVEINNWHNLKTGNNVSIHSHCVIEASGGVEIGNDVSIAHACSILSENHSWGNPDIPIKYNDKILEKVIICDDVWVGCGCRILAGVNIGKRSIIAAGAVVTKNVEGNVIYGGVPAKKIKQI